MKLIHRKIIIAFLDGSAFRKTEKAVAGGYMLGSEYKSRYIKSYQYAILIKRRGTNNSAKLEVVFPTIKSTKDIEEVHAPLIILTDTKYVGKKKKRTNISRKKKKTTIKQKTITKRGTQK